MTPKEFGQAIKVQRHRLGITQEQLADEIGCHPDLVTAWELGRRMPKVRDLQALGEFFDSHAFDTALEAFVIPDRRGILPDIYGGCVGSYVAIKTQAEEMLADVAAVQSTVSRSPDRWETDTVHILKMNALDLIRTATRMLIELESLFGGSASKDHQDHLEWMRGEGYLQTESGRPDGSRAA